MTPKLFYSTYISYAVKSERNTKVPALFTLAQAALESSWGKRAPGNNFFGIKDTDGINGNEQVFLTHEVVKGKTIEVKQTFRKYNSPAESFDDHGRFLVVNKRYAPAFKTTDPVLFAKEVAVAGYATDPEYATKIISIIKLLTA